VTDGCVKLGEDISCDSCSTLCEADGVIESVDGVASGGMGAVGGLACDIDGVGGAAPFC
jgi:hypothetical protein